MRNKLIVVGFLALAVFLVLSFMTVFKHESSDRFVLGNTNSGGIFEAQVIGANGNAASIQVNNGKQAATNPVSLGRFPAVWQRDKNQYADEAEWRTWAASACSAASLSSVLNGYGIGVRVTDILTYLQQQNAIKAGAGLYRYDVFSTIAQKYGLKAVYSEDKDLDAHFGRVLDYLKQGTPVILNVLDSTFFPAGHFIVGTGINGDGTIAIMNPDPASGKSVNQSWSVEGLKLYFSRMNRSAAILPR